MRKALSMLGYINCSQVHVVLVIRYEQMKKEKKSDSTLKNEKK